MESPGKYHIAPFHKAGNSVKKNYETHISTKQHKTQAKTRVSLTDAYESRKTNPQGETSQREKAACSLISKVSDNTERFPEKYRLTRPSDFQAVFKNALRYADRKFLVLARKNGMGCARLGLAISAKRIKSAVKRNKVKRLVRESFRQNRHRLKGLDIVVIAQQNTAPDNNVPLARSLAELWDRVVQ